MRKKFQIEILVQVIKLIKEIKNLKGQKLTNTLEDVKKKYKINLKNYNPDKEKSSLDNQKTNYIDQIVTIP